MVVDGNVVAREFGLAGTEEDSIDESAVVVGVEETDEGTVCCPEAAAADVPDATSHGFGLATDAIRV